QRLQEVDPRPAGLQQPIEHFGQLVLENLAVAGEKIVWLMELRDASALPSLPGLGRGARHVAGVALADGPYVSVARKHHCRGESNHASTADDDVTHQILRLVVSYRWAADPTCRPSRAV